MQDDLLSLRRLWGGFQSSAVIITAATLGVFEAIKSAKSAPQTARAIKCDPRATERLLDALCGLGLATKKSGRYANSKLADKYLVKGRPLYQGDIVRHAGNMWASWSNLAEVVRTGRPRRGGSFDHEAFIMGMHNLSVLRSPELLKAIGIEGVKSALDLGGGPGTHAINMSKLGIKATVFDMPETIDIAKRVARKEAARGMSYIAGDFHTDNIGGPYDLILISQIFHAYGVDDCRVLLAKCMSALNPGGRIAVHEFPLSPDRTSPPPSALFGINMLVATERGNCYTAAEISSWMSGAGLSKVKVKKLSETVLLIGEKVR